MYIPLANPVPAGYNPPMPSLWARIFTLVLMAWASVYCCCNAPAQAARIEAPKHSCCSEKHPADHHQQDKKPCNECPFIALRQTTVLTTADHTIAPPAPLEFVQLAPPPLFNITTHS